MIIKCVIELICLSLPVDEYNITIHDWERDYTVSTEFFMTFIHFLIILY